MNELIKQCPQCKSTNVRETGYMAKDSFVYQVVCDSCGHTTTATTQDEARDNWNKEQSSN
ncbi:MAG: hypothetical protein NC218_01485 [Acetobacter sp.]|nr:hypothetical protein [Acetobacter sp.]